MQSKKHILFSVFAMVLLGIFSVQPVFAQTEGGKKVNLQEQVTKQLDAGAKKAELGKPDPRLVIAQTIQMILSLVGIVFVVLIIFAGYTRFTAQGEEDKIQKSNKTIMGAIIGIIIIILSYSISEFVVRRVQNAVQTESVYEASDQGPPSDQWAVPVFYTK